MNENVFKFFFSLKTKQKIVLDSHSIRMNENVFKFFFSLKTKK